MSYSFHINQYVEISLKEEAFTDDFLNEYRGMMYDFGDISDHAEHLSQLIARGVISTPILSGQHFEGYGSLNNFIKDVKLGQLIIEPCISDE